MLNTGNLSINTSFRWSQQEFAGQSRTSRQSRLDFDENIGSGSAAGKVNAAFFLTGTLGSGLTQRIDLFNLTGGSPITGVNLSGGTVKLMTFYNDSTGIVGYDFQIKGTGVGGLIQPFNSGYLGMTIRPQSYKIFLDKNSGYNVTTGERYFYMIDAGSGATYQTVIMGVSIV